MYVVLFMGVGVIAHKTNLGKRKKDVTLVIRQRRLSIVSLSSIWCCERNGKFKWNLGTFIFMNHYNITAISS